MDKKKGVMRPIVLPKEEDPYAFLMIVQNPDGSLTRSTIFPLSPPNSDSSSSAPVLSKDVLLNPTHNTWIRIFRPQSLHHPPNPNPTLPIIIFFHGSGFILLSADSEPFHWLCEQMALELPALIVSLDYRLAPEHPLPAAYDDAVDAIRWVRDESHRDPWFDSADFSRCFLMGNSAGGNIVYHSALRALDLQTPHFKIAGLIMHEPFFGGAQRTESELRLAIDRSLPLSVIDMMWRMALPVGAHRDHEFCNPMISEAHHDQIGQLPKCLVTGHRHDPLVDRQRSFVRMLEGRGVHVVVQFDEDGYHGIEILEPERAHLLLLPLKSFVSPHG